MYEVSSLGYCIKGSGGSCGETRMVSKLIPAALGFQRKSGWNRDEGGSALVQASLDPVKLIRKRGGVST